MSPEKQDMCGKGAVGMNTPWLSGTGITFSCKKKPCCTCENVAALGEEQCQGFCVQAGVYL